MTTGFVGLDPNTWRPQARYRVSLGSQKQVAKFNDTGGVAVFIDVRQGVSPEINISGSQCRALALWETKSSSGFVTKPKFSADLLTIRFTSSGRVSYKCRDREITATTSIAALTGFDDLREVRSSSTVSTISVTFALDSLMSAYEVLNGENQRGLPSLKPIAEMTRPGMWGLFNTARLVQRRLQDSDQHADLLLSLFQEVLSYQFLSVWPTDPDAAVASGADIASRHLQLAIHFIEANLATAITLADISAAAHVSARSLQAKFKKELGKTPIQYIIEQRLNRAHGEIVSTDTALRSISEIARSWGFVHMSDFGQRYRRLFGCSPSESRRRATGTI